MSDKEAQLIRECQNGSREAFGSLYETYAKKIYDFVFFRTFDKSVAEDITSIAFIKAFENMEKFDPKKGMFSSWMYRIAQNAVIDHFRSEKRVEGIDAYPDLGEVIGYEKRFDERKSLEVVKEYMKKLTKEQQEIVRLRVWDELSYREIAELTGKTEGSCKVMFSRVISKMREELPHTLLLLALVRSSFER